MKVEFGHLEIGDKARYELADSLDNNWISMGPKVKRFEQGWGELFGYSSNMAVSSGTDAVINMCLALYKFGARAGDNIIVPALSYIATANAVRAAGFTPKFVDIKRDTLNIDEELIEAAIDDRTIAIMPVHTMGRMCEMDKICEIAKEYCLYVLEDACEAHGATFKGKRVGLWGDASAYSFYIAHLISCGEGGMVSSKNKEFGPIINSTRNHGRKNGDLYFDFPNVGYNSKMNDLEACIGLEGLDNFNKVFEKRRQIRYNILNALTPIKKWVHFSEEDLGNINCPHGLSFTLRKADDSLLEAFKERLEFSGIHWKRNFGSTPQHGAFKSHPDHSKFFPEAEHAGNYGIHIGCHQYITPEQEQYIINTINNFFHEQHTNVPVSHI